MESVSDQTWTAWVAVAITLSVITLVVFFAERWWHMGKLERLGYSSPPRHILLGNLRELFKANANVQDGWKELIDKYGSQVGNVEGKSIAIYQGRIPFIVVTDPEVIKYICVKNFNNFRNRPHSRLDQDRNLLTIRDGRWKAMRSGLSPSFTQAKMKNMSNCISDSISTTLDLVDDHVKEDKPVDFYRLYHGLTMEVICKCAFSINVEPQRNPNDPLLVNCEKIISRISQGRLRRMAQVVFPALAMKLRILINIWAKFGKPINIVRNIILEAMRMQEHTQGKRTPDALQLMMEAAHLLNTGGNGHRHTRNGTNHSESRQPSSKDSKMSKDHSFKISVTNDVTQVSRQPSSKDPKISKDQIADYGIAFILAGYDTTSTMLSYTTYMIAKHQDVQQRLYEEIQQYMTGKDEVTYDIVNQMVYLDMVANESMRVFPPITSLLTREVEEDCEFEGMKFPSNCIVGIPISYMHYNEKLWPDPKTFNPERFHPDRKKDIHVSAFLPFGLGPRSCLGMRFAVMEAKLAIVRLLLKYQVHTCDSTDESIAAQEGSNFLTPQSGHIYLTCTPRLNG